MTEDTSPENLRKFLESDDPALVRMGLSMAKGSGVPEDLLGMVAGSYMWYDDKGVRDAAKSVLNKNPEMVVKMLRKILSDEDSFTSEEFYEDKEFEKAESARDLVIEMIEEGTWPKKIEEDLLMIIGSIEHSSATGWCGTDNNSWYGAENHWMLLLFFLIDNDADADIFIQILTENFTRWDPDEINAWDCRVLYLIMVYGIDFDEISSHDVKIRIEKAGDNQGITEKRILRVKEAARKIIVEIGLDPEDKWAYSFEEE